MKKMDLEYIFITQIFKWYIFKGWVIFKFENEGEFKLKEGDCVHQIPGIKHEEIEHSDDLEMLEITMPADFETKICEQESTDIDQMTWVVRYHSIGHYV